MTVLVDGRKKKFPGTVKNAGELLAKLGISREEALVKIGGEVVPETAPLPKNPSGKIEIIRVVYGG